MAEREAKPPWSAVPRAVKAEVARILGSPVASAERMYGGYAPSATFRLVLRNGRRAFLKSTYPLPKGSAVVWGVADEERAYRALGARIRPWAPALFGSFDVDGWHGLVLEDLGPADVPPWTAPVVGRASYARARFARSSTSTRGRTTCASGADCASSTGTSPAWDRGSSTSRRSRSRSRPKAGRRPSGSSRRIASGSTSTTVCCAWRSRRSPACSPSAPPSRRSRGCRGCARSSAGSSGRRSPGRRASTICPLPAGSRRSRTDVPEWPDLHVVRGRLEKTLVGREITLVRIGGPLVLRARVDVGRALAHRVFRAVRHRGKFLLFELDRGRIVVNPMLAGVFELADAESKLTRTTALSLVLDDGNDLRYRDDKRMGKVHVLEEGDDLGDVHGFADLGPDAGTLDWNATEFAERARATRRELRNLLMDQTFVAGIGNAYADEILWEARLHPKRRVATLSEDELHGLFDAVRSVIARGVTEVEAGLPPELGTKVRDHMKVRGHRGKPCPRCGTPIVKTRHGLDDMYLCPPCPPPPRGQIR